MVPGPRLWWPPSIAGARALPTPSTRCYLRDHYFLMSQPRSADADCMVSRPPRSVRALKSCLASGGLTIALLATCTPSADAQGTPADGAGAHYYLAGAGNTSGRAIQDFWYG